MSTSTLSIKAVFLIIFSATLAWGQQCNPTQVQYCFKRYGAGMAESWPRTKEELEKKCTDFSNLVDCLKDSIQNCDGNLKVLFDGVENFKTETCNINSPMAKGFAKHSGCMRNAHANMQRCTMSKVRQEANPCPAVYYIAQCSDETYGAQCGADANQLAKKMYGIILQAACPQEVKDYLSSAHSLKYSVIPAFLLPAAMLLMRFLRDEM